jgi:hypothetical protein
MGLTPNLVAWRSYELGNPRARRDYALTQAAAEPARCLARDCRRLARTRGGLCMPHHREEAALALCSHGIPHNVCKEKHE